MEYHDLFIGADQLAALIVERRDAADPEAYDRVSSRQRDYVGLMTYQHLDWVVL